MLSLKKAHTLKCDIKLKEGFDKPEILLVFNAGTKMKPEYRLSIRGFHFCDKAEDGQKIGFAKPSKKGIIIFPNHGSQEMGKGLEKKILKDAGIQL